VYKRKRLGRERKGSGEINGKWYNGKWKIKDLKFSRRNPIK